MSSDDLLEEFRLDLREWIERSRPDGLESLVDWNGSHGGGSRRERIARAMEDPRFQEWERRLKEAKLICPQWPAEVGGSGLSAPQLAVFSEELNRFGLPRVHRGMGEGLVGPSLIIHGDDGQRSHFLPRIISNDDVYCQGFSEPGHGSDLAGVETKGEIDGDEIVITGQKVWTSGAADANMIFVLCRTGPDLAKHAGLTYVLVPIADNGFTIRPIRQISGASGFCEVFIDGARAPIQNIVGGLNNGWRVAMTTLSNERGAGATVQHLPYEREFWDLVSVVKERGLAEDPLLRQKLARAFSHVQIMRFSGLRTMAALRAHREPRVGTLTGKLFWSEYNKWFGETAVNLLGADALIRPSEEAYGLSTWQELFLHSRAGTIFAGTSEIQRNVISERGLGLPKS